MHPIQSVPPLRCPHSHTHLVDDRLEEISRDYTAANLKNMYEADQVQIFPRISSSLEGAIFCEIL